MSSDQELIRAIASGNRDAFADFYDRHSPKVFGFLVKLLPNRGDAEDALQEVFWQVWKQASRHDPQRATPTVWLFLMARSRAIDLMRKRRAEPLEDRSGQSVPANEPATDLVEYREQISVALQQLPIDQRTPIQLSFFHGLAHHDIAARLQIPLGTAKTRIRAGMKSLRQQLGSTEPVGLSEVES